MIKINAAALRAVMAFKAKDDIRQQLNGVTVSRDRVIGSDGFAACIIETDTEFPADGVLFIDKVPLASAEYVTFDNGTAISYDAKDQEKARCGYRFEPQGNLLDFDRVTPDKLCVEPEGFFMAPDFLGKITKAFPRPKKAGKYAIKLVHSMPSNHWQPYVFDVSAYYLPTGAATVLIMGVKE